MGTLPVSGLPDMGQAAPGNYLRFDEFAAANEKMIHVTHEVDCSAGGTIALVNNGLPTDSYLQGFRFKLIGTPAGAFTLQVPDGDRQLVVWNASGQQATVDTATGAASPPVLADGEERQILVDGTELKVVTYAAGLGDVVDDLSPQLGGNLDVNGKAIVSVSNGDIPLTPNGTGQVKPGATNFQDAVVSRPELKDYAETRTAPSISAGTLTLNLETGNVFEVTLTENVTSLVFSNPPASGKAGTVTLIVAQDGTGGRTLAWPGSVKWKDAGTTPAVTSAANAIDIYTFLTVDGGTSWYGFNAGQDFA